MSRPWEADYTRGHAVSAQSLAEPEAVPGTPTQPRTHLGLSRLPDERHHQDERPSLWEHPSP